MKVIQQIADYLLQHGVLSQKQYDGLEDGGFIDGPEGGGDRSAPELAKTPDSATAAGRTEAVEEAFDRTVPRRAGGGRPNRGATIKVARLRQMVGQRLDALEPVLQGLVPLASTLGPCESWDQATLAIRQASPEALLEAITESLEQGRPTLEPVGKVLEQEAFYEVVQDQTIKGPAVQAYRMLLAGTERTGLGKYAWILKHPEFKRVHNILLCQRSLALALKGLLDHRPRLLDRAFKRDFHPLVYAICVVVYTARQRTPAQVPTAGRGAHHPTRIQSIEKISPTAWTWAILAAPEPVMKLMECHEQFNTSQISRLSGHMLSAVEEWAPRGSDVQGDLKDYLTGLRSQGSLPRARRIITMIKRDQRAALEEDDVWGSIIWSCPADFMDGFSEAWLAELGQQESFWISGDHDDTGLLDLVHTYFSLSNMLICPRSWDY